MSPHVQYAQRQRWGVWVQGLWWGQYHGALTSVGGGVSKKVLHASSARFCLIRMKHPSWHLAKAERSQEDGDNGCTWEFSERVLETTPKHQRRNTTFGLCFRWILSTTLTSSEWRRSLRPPLTVDKDILRQISTFSGATTIPILHRQFLTQHRQFPMLHQQFPARYRDVTTPQLTLRFYNIFRQLTKFYYIFWHFSTKLYDILRHLPTFSNIIRQNLLLKSEKLFFRDSRQ